MIASSPRPHPRTEPFFNGLLRGLYDCQMAVNAFVARRLDRSVANRMRRTIHGDAYRTLLQDSLRHAGDQRSWTDAALREHALTTVLRHFGDDSNWCMQVMLTVYLCDPQSIDEIDTVIEQHVESRTGAFAPALYQGKGWNPARAIYFNADTARYWRIYRAFTRDSQHGRGSVQCHLPGLLDRERFQAVGNAGMRDAGGIDPPGRNVRLDELSSHVHPRR